MYLPPRALALISEYSKPITRDDWKKVKKFSQIHFNDSLKYSKTNKILDLLYNTYWLTGPIYTNLYYTNTSICIIKLSFTVKKIDGKFAEVKDKSGNIIKSIINIRYNNYHKHYNEELIIPSIYYYYTLSIDNLVY
jgi:hypothetical protein